MARSFEDGLYLQIVVTVNSATFDASREKRLTSSQPCERVNSTIYCNANELLSTNLFADCRNLFVL